MKLFFGLNEIVSNWSVPIGSAVLAVALAATTFFLLRKRISPDEAERLRRLDVGTHGRLIEGMVTDVQENTVYFSYSVRGVEYQAAQDLSTLLDRVPGALHTLVGPITLRYIANNPANSVVLCEKWSGLRSILEKEPRDA
jgi:hypothetical protein